MVWLIIIIALMIPLVAVVLDSHLGRALADAISGRGRSLDNPPDNKRLAALESEVERLNKEIERLDEESRFLQRLLEQKTAPPPELPPGSNGS